MRELAAVGGIRLPAARRATGQYWPVRIGGFARFGGLAVLEEAIISENPQVLVPQFALTRCICANPRSISS